MHTLNLGLTCRCVCPILTYGKSSKVRNMMAIFFRHSRLPVRVQTCRQKDFNRHSAEIRELFCVLELSSMFQKEKNRKEKWKETGLVFPTKAFTKNLLSWIAFKLLHCRCNSSYIFSTWTFRKITYIEITKLFVSYIIHI